ncbi:MAG: hypothetical protein ACLUTO_14540 [Anaerostipes sp.]
MPKLNKETSAEKSLFYALYLEEQQKIGDYFRSLDRLITLHQWKQKTTEVNSKHQKHNEIIFINI